MTSSAVNCYVVAEGVVESLCTDINRRLSNIGGPFDDIDEFSVEAVARGVVKVGFFCSEWRLASAAKRAATLHLTAQGYQVLDELPPTPVHEPIDPAMQEVTPQTEPDGTDDTLLVDSVLTILAERGSARVVDMAETLSRSPGLVEALLHDLASAGLLAGNIESVFTLTEAGAKKALAATNYRGGRKAVFEALIENEELTTYDLASLLGVALTMTKKSVRLLVGEGMVEPGSKEARQGRARPRQRYRLSAVGREIGHDYVPSSAGRPKHTWEDPSERQAQVMQALLGKVRTTVTQACDMTGASNRYVLEMLNDGHRHGYLDREVVQETPRTYGFTLTDSGLDVVQKYVAAHPQPDVTEVAEPVVYRLTVVGDAPELSELLTELAALTVVILEPWTAS